MIESELDRILLTLSFLEGFSILLLLVSLRNLQKELKISEKNIIRRVRKLEENYE